MKQGRLDIFLISNSLSNLVENCSIKPGYRSDHSIVLLELKFNPFTKGRGLWKFNNTLLSDKEYVVKVKDIIQSVSSQYLDNVESGNFQCKSGIDESLFFEVLMMEIRGATISYSTYRKKVRNNTEEKLIQEIEYIESNSTVDINTLDEKKSALEKLRKEKLLGHMVRSRAQLLEEGEKPSKYFCNLESRNYLNKTIKKIEAEDIGMLHEQGEILDYVKKYYEKLYASVDTNLVKID